MSRSTIVALRHIERDKANKADPQVATHSGELQAFAMGTLLRREHGFVPDDVTSSPQGRAVRTAKLLLAGINGADGSLALEVKTDPRLDDYSSDKRPEIVACLASAKEYGEKHGLEVEQAAFATEVGIDGINVKVNEALELFNELRQNPGNHLVAGLHGCTIDGICATFAQILYSTKPFGPGANGGIFDKVEGFTATFKDSKLVNLVVIRQPPWLKAMGLYLK